MHSFILSLAQALTLMASIPVSSGPEPRAATTLPAPTRVTIDNFAFNPKEITVPVGATIIWVNRDDVPHTATSRNDPPTFDSKALDTDGIYSFTFTKPGTYGYYCKVHNHMTGTVIVK